MPDSLRRRADGVEFAVGWFLMALGLGLLVPRPAGAGLYTLLHSTGYGDVWSAGLIVSAAALIGCSYVRHPVARLTAIVVGLIAWTALAFMFVSASLWGASAQCIAAIFLLNASMFRQIEHWSRNGKR